MKIYYNYFQKKIIIPKFIVDRNKPERKYKQQNIKENKLWNVACKNKKNVCI